MPMLLNLLAITAASSSVLYSPLSIETASLPKPCMVNAAFSATFNCVVALFCSLTAASLANKEPTYSFDCNVLLFSIIL